jgi:hypothetical protein
MRARGLWLVPRNEVSLLLTDFVKHFFNCPNMVGEFAAGVLVGEPAASVNIPWLAESYNP